MILITGGTSFNSSHFIKIQEDLIVILNKTKPKIIQDNITYFENLKEFKNQTFTKR